MRKLVLSTFVSLDGVVEAPEDWQEPFWSDELQEFAHKLLFASDALLLGRRTYELFARAWPNHEDEEGFADRMNSVAKHVVSASLTEVDWTNSSLLTGELAEAIIALKNGPGGDILIYGSMDLTRSLMRQNLIDEYHIWVHPVIVGGGPRLFRDGTATPALNLVDTKIFDTGVVVLSYEPR